MLCIESTSSTSTGRFKASTTLRFDHSRITNPLLAYVCQLFSYPE